MLMGHNVSIKENIATVSAGNSKTNLTGVQAWVGSWAPITNQSAIQVISKFDKDVTLYIDQGSDGVNADFTDYKMLGPSDMPNATIILVESAPDPIGPMGAKSCGESALMGPIGSAANAIYDAIGIQFTQAPITAEKVLKAIKEQGIK